MDVILEFSTPKNIIVITINLFPAQALVVELVRLKYAAKLKLLSVGFKNQKSFLWYVEQTITKIYYK